MLALVGITLIWVYLALHVNVVLRKALAHQATHDELTGLPNRTLLKRRLERELAAIPTGRQPVTLMMLDLDGFKEVNDFVGTALVTRCWCKSRVAWRPVSATATR